MKKVKKGRVAKAGKGAKVGVELVSRSPTGNLLLPICWLGKVRSTYTYGRIKNSVMKVVLGTWKKEDVNMQCTCTTPLQALICGEGHVDECHKGMSCEIAQCHHYTRRYGGKNEKKK